MIPHNRIGVMPVLLVSGLALVGCSSFKPPAITYDDPAKMQQATLLPDPPRPVQIVALPQPLPLPGQLRPLTRGRTARPEAGDPRTRVDQANEAARVQPTRAGYINAVQVYPFSDGALFQVYAAPGQVTDIALQEGEQLTGSGPVASGDTVRWIIGDTESGTGAAKRVHILVKPTRPDLTTNLVINTDRRTYHLEMRSAEKTYMASVSWQYPADQLIALRRQNAAADAAAPVEVGVDVSRLRFRYRIEGDNPAWRPLSAFDDEQKVYIEMPRGIGQGDAPPLFVLGPDGKGELVNYRVLASSIAVFGATIWALQVNRHSRSGEELYSTDNKSTADGLANLPRDYTGLPRNVPPLGPPLPGDLGRPIVAAQANGQPVTVPAMPTAPGVDPEEQRRMQEREAARLSKLFAGTGVREQPVALRTTGPETPQPGSGQAGPQVGANDDPDFRQNGQDRKLAFANGPTDRRTISPDRLQAPASPYVLQAGTVIAGALVTGIRSDLPGQITGQVTENVYDSPTGRYLLIPQGAKLIGTYDSQVTFGQSRVLLVWTRVIMPNGTSIVLERQSGADTQGFSGLEDGVDNHWGELFKAALLSTLLSIGSEAGSTGQQSDLFQALRRGASDSISQTGNQVVRRNLNIQPTLTIRPGFPVRVIVNRDLVLAPYGA